MFKRIALLALAAAAPLAQASSYTTLTLPTLNADIRGWTDGATYNPLFPGLHTWNGVPFQLAADANGNTVFLNGVLDMTANVFGATQAFTLINSAFGAYGANNGSIEFFGSGGAYYKVDLVQGINVRDHYDGGFNNTIDNINAVAAFNVGPGRARLDEQIFNLPSAFATQTLQTIRFTGLNTGSNGNPFIAAATVSAIPEPEAMSLMLVGLGLLAWNARRRNA